MWSQMAAVSATTRDARDIVRSYDATVILLRWAAMWVDYIVLALVFMVPALLGAFSPQGNELYQNTLLTILVGIAAAYFPVLEGLTGRTVGKFLLGLKVVDIHGQTPGILRALLRFLPRLIELNP